jgi:hypothetical protein
VHQLPLYLLLHDLEQQHKNTQKQITKEQKKRKEKKNK